MADDDVVLAVQAGRFITVEFASLQSDLLLITGFTAHEAISSLFSLTLELISQKPDQVILDDIVGQNVTVALALEGDSRRFFNGFISRFSLSGQELGDEHRFTHYQAEVVPWLWFLSKIRDCRIFQDKTVPDILKLVFDGAGFKDFRIELTRSYTSWDYCVQYRETDFHFVSRLMEEEGIFYFFVHESGKHTLVLADTPQSHPDCPGQPQARFDPEGGFGEREDVVDTWVMQQELRSGKYTLRDYHFEMPSKSLEVTEPTKFASKANEDLEIYDYPGGYAQKFNKPGERLEKVQQEGETLVKLNMEEEEEPHVVIHGSSICRAFTAGTRFELLSPPPGVTSGPYVLTSIQHSATQAATFVSGQEDSVDYSNSFTCIPHQNPFRPQRITPKPTIPGPQTAVVVGPAGEEIFVDKHGRVKVQFNWDRLGKHDDKSSAFVRVCQIWAGKNWGAMFIPRIGQEVMVDFMEGDPDQPIITGRLYNADNMPFYELPKFKTISDIKSNTSPGGKGFNEIRFEDRKDKEQVFIHSQRRMDVRVRQSMYETIGGTRQICVGGNLALTVGGDTDIHIKGAEFEGIDGKLNQGIKGDVVLDYGANDATVVKAKYELNAQQITIEALQQITLKVGSSFVVVDLTGVTIQGPLVRINSGGGAAGTGPAVIDDPLDCEGADTGEPGFLDRPRKGGGRGRRRRTLTGQHGPDVTYNPNDQTFSVGNVTIQPGTNNPNFQRDVLNDLATIGTTPQGQATLDSINNSGRTVTIRERPPNPNDPFNAEATALNGANATNGTGSDTSIEYDPTQYPVPNSLDPQSQHNAPSDVILHHELSHAEQNANGTNDFTPIVPNDCFDDVGERNTIGNPNGPDNDYRRQRGVEPRTDHKDY
jgi:type VI secretion system secreted protein VgrG